MAKRDPRRQPADFHLWAAVARSVRPLRPLSRLEREARDEPLPLPLDPPPAAARPPFEPFLPAFRADARPGPRTLPGQVIEPNMRRHLARGRIELDGTIDLHGMRQDEARGALNRFLKARHARGDRTVLVITGKGLKKADGDSGRIVQRGVLRAMLPVWLSEPGLAPLVAGWGAAAQGHGGEGAFYVRLRRGGQ